MQLSRWGLAAGILWACGGDEATPTAPVVDAGAPPPVAMTPPPAPIDAGGDPIDAAPDAGVDPLAGADGIAGKFAGQEHSFKVKVEQTVQPTTTVVVDASSAESSPQDQWRIRFTPTLGKQSCTGGTTTTDTFIQFSSFPSLAIYAATDCEIDVTSIAPKFEGTFTATLPIGGEEVEVTDGAFRVVKSGT